ncbi:hypothetical protein HYY74_06020 [Candidatus Woesearchaeota archaeon]|nr:hypothetical protein [Candidatus Woesearchaeota archaeon]
MIDVLTDANYQEFMQAGLAVIIATKESCGACAFYKPRVERAAEADAGVRFGNAQFDAGHLGQFKRKQQ